MAPVPVEQNDFGFVRSYEVEINPERPSTGGWQVTEFRFGERGRAGLAIRVTPDGGKAWVASFALEPRGLLCGVYACPNPGQLMVLTGDDALLMTASDPAATKTLPIHPTIAVTRPQGTNLLVVGSFTNALAIDGGGVLWVTDRLFRDDLELVGGAPGKILVRGTLYEGPEEPKLLELDPATGRVVGR